MKQYVHNVMEHTPDFTETCSEAAVSFEAFYTVAASDDRNGWDNKDW